VIESIGLRKAKTPFDFGIIAGDNIYPRAPAGINKKPFTKNYYKRTLDYGFGLLDTLKIPYYTALGNHDVVKGDVLQNQLGMMKRRTPQYVAEVVPGKLRLIVLDTNLLQLELTEPTKQLYGIRTTEEGWRTVARFLDGVAPFKGWTMVVGHEPIFTMKSKDSGIVGLVYYKELLEKLVAIPKCVYICADLHAFQVSQFTVAGAQLPMVVIGTGGANPDKVEQRRNSTTVAGTGIQWKILDTVPAYGYCEGKLRGNQLTFTYMPLRHCTPGQQKVRLVFKRDGGLEVKRMGHRIAYNPEKCAATPVLPALCSNDPRENPRLEGVGRYVRREYRIYQKK
jgi:hypothetical protein